VHAAPAPPAADGTQLVTLKNGLRVLIVPDAAAVAVDVTAWYDAGVRTEHPGAIGLSHLFEHLSFEGTGADGIAGYRRRADAVGGTIGALTTPDFTCYSLTLPPAALETALQLEAARMSAPAPTQAQLDAARATVRDENNARTRGNPLEPAQQRLYALAFTQHPYGRPTLGLDADLARLPLKECRDYQRERYGPERALLTVVGAVDPASALALVRRVFEPVRPGGATNPVPVREPAQLAERRATLPAAVSTPVLLVGYLAPGVASEDGAALDVAAALLARGNTARLQQAMIYGTGSALFAQAVRDARREVGLFTVTLVAQPQADSAAVERALFEQIDRLAREPASADEVERARKQLEAAAWFGRQTVRDRAQALGSAQMLNGDYHAATAQVEALRNVTPADVQRAASRWLTPGKRNIVWVIPAARGTGAPPAEKP
jgi:zinc protease